MPNYALKLSGAATARWHPMAPGGGARSLTLRR